MKKLITTAGLLSSLALLGCDQLAENKKLVQSEPSPAAPQAPAAGTESKRFVFPDKAGPFPEASVALDTTTGRLCKTYSWDDSARLPKGLPLCANLNAASPDAAVTGARKAYAGFMYTFDGAKWIKGKQALQYNPKTGEMEPFSEDQYDPVNLFSKEEKSKRTLTAEQIRKIANQFNVSYDEAVKEAKQQGYQVNSCQPF